jgi:hypothetical protein
MTTSSKETTTTKEKKAATPKKKRTRSYSINDIIAWKFEPSAIPEKWTEHIGDIDSRFLMYVDGEPGNGKTEYILQFAKMLCIHFGKTRLNNVEQGKHTQIQESVLRNKFREDIPQGKGLFQYDNIRNFDDFVAKIKKQASGNVIIIDSISYWPLSPAQIKLLIDTFKKKSFVFVGYKAHFTKNQPIIHDCDIKVRVERFVAYVTGSRFGGSKNYYIWPERFNTLVGVAPTEEGQLPLTPAQDKIHIHEGSKPEAIYEVVKESEIPPGTYKLIDKEDKGETVKDVIENEAANVFGHVLDNDDDFYSEETKNLLKESGND